MTLPWYDVDMRGRRLEALCKRMNTECWKALNENEHDLALAYYDRLLKTDHMLQPYIEQITGVKKLIKDKKLEGSIQR